MKLDLRYILTAIYVVLSIAGLLVQSARWQLSAFMGPSEHLGLLINVVKESGEYLDGVRRWPLESVLRLLLHGAVWMGGAFLCVWLVRSSSQLEVFIRMKLLLLAWVLVGAVNVWLFAIRSV